MDKNKLLYFIKNRGYKIEDFCEKLGISKGIFYRRLKNERFTVNEITNIAKVLDLSLEDINSIFFADFVS